MLFLKILQLCNYANSNLQILCKIYNDTREKGECHKSNTDLHTASQVAFKVVALSRKVNFIVKKDITQEHLCQTRHTIKFVWVVNDKSR